MQMLTEIIDIFRNAAVAIVQSGVDTLGIVGKAIFDAIGIIGSESASAGTSEIAAVMLLFAGALYLSYKLFWDTAKTVFFFCAVLAVLLAVFIAAVI